MSALLRLICVCLIILSATNAFACGHLKKSEPRAGQALTQSPTAVTIWFSEDMDEKKSWIKVKDASGGQINDKSFSQNQTAMTTKLPTLPAGTYKVTWQMTAKDCGHVSKGNFMFDVR
jgi:methionine-rich copper-binding protein CopC